MYVTYTDLIQLLIFIVALVSLCYEIFKGTLTGIWLSASQLFGLFVCLALSYGLIIPRT